MIEIFTLAGVGESKRMAAGTYYHIQVSPAEAMLW